MQAWGAAPFTAWSALSQCRHGMLSHRFRGRAFHVPEKKTNKKEEMKEEDYFGVESCLHRGRSLRLGRCLLPLPALGVMLLGLGMV